MFQFLEEHNYFVSMDQFDNSKGQKYGLEKELYNVYKFIDNEGGVLHIFTHTTNNFHWIYHFAKKPYFIQKNASPIENGPEWVQILIKKIEGTAD
ncbi:hypothetical protein BIV60_11380 [Bacillus sp. MUM 116]|uniref:hypothetical protein n=1 Tax=Bacillus sp. MUM 116 TaxID=1678002 RepID=UPI0008F558CD|nr:hypothetical protein [Bacillus sp. MUM 116]OIK14561.1 hypothetical protein BIV60_11380 [Bacillus sp. MUM 116]